MPVEIRPARASDIAALAALEATAFATDRISPRAFRRLAASRSAALLVAGREGDPAGYCAVLFRAGSRKARLYSIAVRPGAEAGLGRRLLDAAEALARRHGCETLRLEVRDDNSRAIALYERNGYRLFARRPSYYADGAEARRYEKRLLPHPAETSPIHSREQA